MSVYIFCTQGVLATNVQHDYNAYYNLGAQILTTADYDPADETARIISNPYPGTAPTLPAIDITPATTWAQLDSLKRVIIALYRISAASPVVNNGIDAGTLPYPGVVDDIEGIARTAGSYDIGAYEYSNIATEAAPVPVEMAMISATPNPFNPAVTISVVTQKFVSLRIYDINGRMIADLTPRIQNGLITWNIGTNPVGVYVVNAQISGKNHTKRITLLR